jgi:hypothetical protein
VQSLDQIRRMYQRVGDLATTQAGTTLHGVFQTAERTAFDTALAGDYTLRYLTADAVLTAHDLVTIAGTEYEVIGVPERINAHESTAQLMRAT